MVEVTNYEPFPRCEDNLRYFHLVLSRHSDTLAIVKEDTLSLSNLYLPFRSLMILCHELISDHLGEFYPSSMAKSLSSSFFRLTKRGPT